MSELVFKSISEMAKGLDSGQFTSAELTRAYMDRTAALDSKLNSFVHKNAEAALESAAASDARRAKGVSRGVLDGIPVGVKDALAVEGQPMACGSKMLANYVSPYTATCVKNIEDAGAVLWGRQNMDEFAMGSSCETSFFGPTRNPWDTQRVPGGSSGGSAAAVSAGFCAASLGSDTGGSIRQPAAFCGIVGMKPTYGLVSRYGLGAFASSLDQVGPLARSVEDAAIILEAIVSHDKKDSTSVRIEKPQYSKLLGDGSLKGKKIGVPKEYFTDALNSEVRAGVENSIKLCESLGAEIVEVSLPHTELAVPVYYVIATAEASSNFARFDGVRYGHRSAKATDATDLYFKSRAEGFGSEVKRRLILGTYVLSSGFYDAYYLRAQKTRTLIRDDFSKVFAQGVDVIMTPTSPMTAFKIGEKISDPVAMYMIDALTINANIAGLPALSLPCGFSADGLPIGLQMIGKPFGEAGLLSCAHAFEKVSPFKNAHPSL